MKTAFIIGILAIGWTIGLFIFVDKTRALTPPSPPPPADAIVALTGGSNARLQAAMDLLQDGKGARLLITGVYKSVTKDDLQNVIGGSDELYECCIDLGFKAADTIGNAAETAAWVDVQGVTSLIVVTADFHMPRSLIELKARMPDVALVPYAVNTSAVNPRSWLRDGFSAPRFALEYSKYLMVRAREIIINMGNQFENTSKPDDVASANQAAPE